LAINRHIRSTVWSIDDFLEREEVIGIMSDEFLLLSIDIFHFSEGLAFFFSGYKF